MNHEIIFSDILYGEISLPYWIVPFIKSPEFVRLRGVRLSNVDSYQFKDFGTATRWEHCIAVAALALRCARKRQLDERNTMQLVLAALLHDIATPPFAHSMEHVIEGFDHELESQKILESDSDGMTARFPIFASEYPQFRKLCTQQSQEMGVDIRADEVASLVTGGGDLGFLINGTIDLDNADNVTRACHYLGITVDREVPLRLADWLATLESAPLSLNESRESFVTAWTSYKNALYARFYSSSSEELGREAFLQHLMRRALKERTPLQKLIRNTDEGFLSLLETSETEDNRFDQFVPSLKSLVQRYRLLEEAYEIASVELEDRNSIGILKQPVAANWIEDQLIGTGLNAFIMISQRRFDQPAEDGILFKPARGMLRVFKIGGVVKYNQLPTWLKRHVSRSSRGSIPKASLSAAIGRALPDWIDKRPWGAVTVKRQESVTEMLNSVGNWSFRLSRNESFHSYPSTFVHAIPGTLINCLGLKGELVVDPFGGTGQTAAEAIKTGGKAVSGDSNSVATLIARSRFTYLGKQDRLLLRSISVADVERVVPCKPPAFPLLEKWHHPQTLNELCLLMAFIAAHTEHAFHNCLKATFSSIIAGTTGRRGKEHGFFADNTPLSKGESAPPYQNAVADFLAKLKRNLDITERFYSLIEHDGRNVEEELARCTVVQADSRSSTCRDYLISKRSASGVITSPPYLCMADYSLGQRLSYYWLFPEKLDVDFSREIGARRLRNNSAVALDRYLSDMRRFAKNMASYVIRPKGFLCLILGTPTATEFRDNDITKAVEAVLVEEGYSPFWNKRRNINWHRNHGYSRTKTERIMIYIAP